MRSDTEMLTWMLGMLGLEIGTSDEQSKHGKEAVTAALNMGFTARAAVSAAMGAIRVEPGEELPPMTGVDLISQERQRQIEGAEMLNVYDEAVEAITERMTGSFKDLNTKAKIDGLASIGAAFAAEIDRLRALPVTVTVDLASERSVEGNTFHDRVNPEVTLITPEPFEVGDRVRLVRVDSADRLMGFMVDMEGEILELDADPDAPSNRPCHRVIFDGRSSFLYADQLERIG